MDYKKYYKKSTVISSRETNNHTLSIGDINEIEKIDKIIYYLLLAALLIIPIFIKAHIGEFVSPHLTFMSTGMQADIFSYFKFIFLFIITIVVGILFLYKVLFLRYEIPKSKVHLFLGILAIAVTLSAVFSPYKSLALQGMYNRNEGTLTYICYFIVFFVAANVKYSKTQLHGFLYTLYPFVFINMWLGYALFKGKDLLQVGWIHNFILGSIPEGAKLSEGAKIWATVSNPNYISGIGAVLAVLFLTWAIFDNNKIRSAINVVVAVMSFGMVLTSFSTSGFLTLLVLLPVIFILIFLDGQKIKSFAILIAFIILATSIYIPLANMNPRVWDETFGFIIESNPFKKDQLSYNGGTDAIETNIQINKFNPFQTNVAFAEGQNLNKFQIPDIPEAGVSAGTGRLYIWEKTFETAMQRPILGYGFDTFSYIFPQDDIGKIAGIGNYEETVDKPHNMFLGVLIGSGIISLIVFILLVILILLSAVNILWQQRKIDNKKKALIVALFTTSIAYLVQGLFNDSVIGLAVIYWILFGVLFSLIRNELVKGK
ncbi:MAG TPA: O-antigen ligase family protein [Bacillus bacterium]|nr:O-antigen ligase family protein [Bacillus sp. (in: firmicutes)]